MYTRTNDTAEAAMENWNDVSGSRFLDLDTGNIDDEERNELQGSTITKEDLIRHPEEVKDVARFSANLKLSSRDSLDAFVQSGVFFRSSPER